MTALELIKRLQELVDEHGDLPVRKFSDGEPMVILGADWFDKQWNKRDEPAEIFIF